jgi:hypothetical protein
MAFTARAAPFGNQAYGYWRGGAGVSGPPAAGRGEYGVATQGIGMASQGTVRAAGADWHPTVLYLLGLVVAEMIVFGILGRMLR